MSFVRRLRNSPAVISFGIGLAARLIAGWIRLCQATSRWQVIGLEEADAAMAEGPIVAIIWHECSLMAPAHWPRKNGQVTTLSDPSPIGRVSAAVQGRLGMASIGLPAGGGAMAGSREVLRRLKAGISVGLTGDGPVGPARVLNAAPLEWARAGGVPVFTYAYAMSRGRRLRTWDRMILPMPFSKGVVVYARVLDPLPRRLGPEEMAAAQTRLSAAMSAAVETAERLLR